MDREGRRGRVVVIEQEGERVELIRRDDCKIDVQSIPYLYIVPALVPHWQHSRLSHSRAWNHSDIWDILSAVCSLFETSMLRTLAGRLYSGEQVFDHLWTGAVEQRKLGHE